MRLWKRNIQVIVDETVFGNHYVIEVDLKKENNQTPIEGWVKIHNLSHNRERSLLKPGKSIIINAGYGEELETLYSGFVADVLNERAGQNRITKLTLSDREKGVVLKIMNFTYDEGVGLHEIVTDIVKEMGYTIATFGAVPNKVFEHSFDALGSPKSILAKILKPLGFQWFLDESIIRFDAINKSQPDIPTVKIDTARGMLGTPSTTEDGISVKMLMNPKIRIGALCSLTSKEITGEFKINSIYHSGDNWDGKFKTECILSNLDS